MFSEKDIQQITTNGLTVNQVNSQINIIKSGMSYSSLVKPATIGDGIVKLDHKRYKYLIDVFEKKRDDINIVKFVPASGAATRMFKFLFTFLKAINTGETFDAYADKNEDINIFEKGLKDLPFYKHVVDKVKASNIDIETLSTAEKCIKFVETILNEDQLNYSFFPKGLLPFHKYKTHVATAFEEHLYEASQYASSNGKANLHFTVSKKHKQMFDETLNDIITRVEKITSTNFNISFSFQNSSTETIALKIDNSFYRNDNGELLFRPAGHGALIENLNTLDYDLVFIKNIDNTTVLEQNEKLSDYKKVMAGIVLEVQEQAFSFLHRLENKLVSNQDIDAVCTFLSTKMNVEINASFQNFDTKQKTEYLFDKLNRPLRVCCMVKNEGQPGGGPFWVKDNSGEVSLQITEFAQIDFDNDSQKQIAHKATHFNPTDLVCGVKNYKGEKFNLMEFVDPNAAFITMKTQNGTDIKALELPGLWNGSMAHWNTIFVEAPLETFNPVKTVNDLLNPAHQVL